MLCLGFEHDGRRSGIHGRPHFTLSTNFSNFLQDQKEHLIANLKQPKLLTQVL